MTVPVKKADTIRVRLFSFTRHPRPHKRLNARAYDLELRFMLQFATHFCMHQFLLLADAQKFWRQTSWHDFFCAKAGADTIRMPSAATTDTTFIIRVSPKKRRQSLTRCCTAGHGRTGIGIVFYAAVIPIHTAKIEFTGVGIAIVRNFAPRALRKALTAFRESETPGRRSADFSRLCPRRR